MNEEVMNEEIESRKEFRQKVLDGYEKSPELLSRLLARVLVWNPGREGYSHDVNILTTEINLLVGDNVMKLCDDIAERIIEYASSGSKGN